MMARNGNLVMLNVLAIASLVVASSVAQNVKLVERPPDPHGSPRPARDARDVPIKTSIYLELGIPAQAKAGDVSPESVSVGLREQGGEAVDLLRPGRFVRRGCLRLAATEARLARGEIAGRLHRTWPTPQAHHDDTRSSCRPAP